MNDFQFQIPTHIIFGRSAQARAGKLTASLGTRALILYGSPRIEKSGLLAETTALLEEAGVSFHTFSGITENPLLSTAEAACQAARECQADVLLAIGGGSVIDLAKAVSIGSGADLTGAANSKSASTISLWDYYEQRAVPKKALPLGVILTMAATASEANCVSVLLNDRLGKKVALRCPLIYPRFALLNPELTYTVPARQTAMGALDIFAHAFERYFHLGQRGTLRRELCTAVMKTVVEELPGVLAHPNDYDGRAQLMWAATMAHSDMIGFDGVYACHAMSHILTGEYGLSHGGGLAMLMPAWCRYMVDFCQEEIAGFAKDVWEVSLPEKDTCCKTCQDPVRMAALEGIARFEGFIRQNGLPVTLREAGITGCDCRRLAELTVAANGNALGGNFRALDRAGMEAIYRMAAD